MKEEILSEILELLEEKVVVGEFEDKCTELNAKVNEIKAEMSKFTDKESGFYKDLEEQLATTRKERDNFNRKKNAEKRKVETKLQNKKDEIISKLEEKLKIIDENRKTEIQEQAEDLKQEQEVLEKQVALNDVTKEEFLTMDPVAQREVQIAKERYLINKHRLDEILIKSAILETLDGQEPKAKYLEISDMITEIEEKFTYDNLESYKEEIDKVQEQDVIEEEKTVVEEESPILVAEPEIVKEEKVAQEPKKEQIKQPKIEEQQPKKAQTTQSKNDYLIMVKYNAKDKDYEIENVDLAEVRKINKSDLHKLSKDAFAKKLGKDIECLKNVDMDLIQVLHIVDRKYNTNKVKQYFDIMTASEKTEEEMKALIEKSKTIVNYDLRGLFDKVKYAKNNKKVNKYTLEERNVILENANNAKDIGIADVKKGIKVSMMEAVDKFTARMKKTKMLLATEKEEKKKLKNKPKKEFGIKKFTNKIRNNIAEKAYSFGDRIKVDEEIQQNLNNVLKNSLSQIDMDEKENTLNEQEETR